MRPSSGLHLRIFTRTGRKHLLDVPKSCPLRYLKIFALLVPRELKIEHAEPYQRNCQTNSL